MGFRQSQSVKPGGQGQLAGGRNDPYEESGSSLYPEIPWEPRTLSLVHSRPSISIYGKREENLERGISISLPGTVR
jgi:hypothetical protein